MKRSHLLPLMALVFVPSRIGKTQSIPTTRQLDAQLRQAQAQARKAAGPIRTLSNRGKRPVRLTLSDRVSTITLPAGWKCSSRGFYSRNPDGTMSGSFSHFLRPIKSSSGGLHISILETGSDLGVGRDWRGARNLMVEMARGDFDEFLWKAYRESDGRHPDIVKREMAADLRRKRQQETTLGGLSGYIATTTDGSRLKVSRDGLLGSLPAPRRLIVVFGSTKSWSFADSSAQTSMVQAMLRSFRPG